MRYYLVAGEASGDLHGSNLMKEIIKFDPDAQIRFFGGDLMQQTGGTLVKHYREMAFMGFVNVLLNLKTIGANLKLCKSDISAFQPHAVILIDYPGFNLRIAEYAHTRGFRVFYYIAPKVWAWKEHRVKKLKQFTDKVFTIFPFETSYFARHGMKVEYVGNPLMDSVSQYKSSVVPDSEFRKKFAGGKKPVVALLAGSRVQEIKNILPVMLDSVRDFEDFRFIVAGVSSVNPRLYTDVIKDKNVGLVFDNTYELLTISHAALVASGTATLETALFNVPQFVLYRVEGGWLTYILMKYIFLKVKWISLPNLIMDKTLIREFVQIDMKSAKIKPELALLLQNEPYRNHIFEGYAGLRNKIGPSGCSEKTAREILRIIS